MKFIVSLVALAIVASVNADDAAGVAADYTGFFTGDLDAIQASLGDIAIAAGNLQIMENNLGALSADSATILSAETAMEAATSTAEFA